MAFSLLAESTDDPFGEEALATDRELKEAGEEARHLSGLLNELTRIRNSLPPEDSEGVAYLDRVIAQVSTSQVGLAAAMANGSGKAGQLTQNIQRLVRDHYAEWMLEAGKVIAPGKVSSVSLAAIAWDATREEQERIQRAEVAEIQDYFSGTSEWFGRLSSEAQQDYAETFDRMLDANPELRKGMRTVDRIRKNPRTNQIMEEAFDKSRESLDGLLEEARERNDHRTVRELERMRDLASTSEQEYAPASLQEIHEKLKNGDITWEEAQRDIAEASGHTQRVAEAIHRESFKALSKEDRAAIAEALGKDPSALTDADLVQFVQDNKALTPEEINDAFARERQGTATAEDKARIAAGAMKMTTEQAQILYNYAETAATLSPEQKAIMREELGAAWDKDLDAVKAVFEKHGVDMDALTPAQQHLLSRSQGTLTAEQFQQVLDKAEQAVKDPSASSNVADEVMSIYHQGMVQTEAAAGNSEQVAFLMDPNNQLALRRADMMMAMQTGAQVTAPAAGATGAVTAAPAVPVGEGQPAADAPVDVAAATPKPAYSKFDMKSLMDSAHRYVSGDWTMTASNDTGAAGNGGVQMASADTAATPSPEDAAKSSVAEPPMQVASVDMDDVEKEGPAATPTVPPAQQQVASAAPSGPGARPAASAAIG